MYPCLRLVIDQAPSRESEVMETINAALNDCERRGIITGWTWGGYEVTTTS